jgi:hypothetical protein
LGSYGAELYGAARPTERKRARLSDSDRFSRHRAQKPKYGSPAPCPHLQHTHTHAVGWMDAWMSGWVDEWVGTWVGEMFASVHGDGGRSDTQDQ